jgi:lysophospholipase L1-like esterase
MIEGDPLLRWRGRPNIAESRIHIFAPTQSAASQRQLIRQFSPQMPDGFKAKARVLVSLNSEGFRGGEFQETKPGGTYRVVTLGDSWTFGYSVGQHQAYPTLLEAELNKLDRNKTYEVVDLSVPGYASYQGALLMKRALELNPDLIVIGYAMNELSMAGYAPAPADPGPRLWNTFVNFAKDGLKSVQLVKYWTQLSSYHEGSTVTGLTKYAVLHDRVTAVEPPVWMKESLREYKARILMISDAARARGIRVVLLYPEFWLNGPYLKALKELSAELNLPLVDWSDMLARASQNHVADRERRFGVARSSAISVPDEDRLVDVLFRVSQGTAQVSQRIYISGSHPSLNSFQPNTLSMYDDGTHGDEVAGDKIWSLRVRLPSNSTILYTYTNSGDAGVWDGLDIPMVRQVLPGRFRNGILPLDEFGTAEMHADPWHTNAEGNSIVAKELASIILNGGP